MWGLPKGMGGRAGLKGLAVAAFAAALGGCVHYSPAPLDTAAYPARVAARTLDQPAGAVWTTRDLLPAALAANPVVPEAESRYRAAVAAARAARVSPPGTLTLSTEYANEAAGVSRWLFGVAGEVPLDIGGRRDARLAAADIAALQALYDYGEAVWGVRTALEKAVVERAEADRAAPAAARLATLRRERLERMERRVAAGEDARPDTVQPRSDLIAAERRLSEIEARRAAADAALAKALATPLPVVARLRLAPTSPADTTGLSDWRRQAALTRRDVLRAVADYDAAEAALRLEVAKQYPQVSVGPGYQWDHGVSRLPFNLALALPPSDFNRAAIAEAEARRTAAGRALETAQAGVLGQVDQAEAALSAARTAEARAAGAELTTARAGAAFARRRAAAGEADRVDQLGAEAVAVEAELNGLDARRQLVTAQVDLEDALRRPFDPAEADILAASVQGDRGAPMIRRLVLITTAASLIASAAGAAATGVATVDQATQRRLGVATAALAAGRATHTLPAFARVLDPSPLAALDADLGAAEAAVAASRAEAVRLKALNADDATVSTRAVQAAEAQARADALKVTLLRRRLGLEWGDGVARLSDPRRAELIRSLAAGEAALVRIDTAQGQGQAGLKAVTLDLGASGRARAVVLGPARAAEARLASPGLLALATGPAARSLSPGLTLPVEITLGGGAGVVIPRSAVIRSGGRAYAYVRRDATHFDRRPIDGAVPQPEGLVAPSGFAAGEAVVVSGGAALYAAETAPAAEPE